MSFDVRGPIGLMFLAIGLLVGGYGAAVAPPTASGINIDLVWGAVMAGFGLLMLGLAWRARARR